jgi:hypothetical protein
MFIRGYLEVNKLEIDAGAYPQLNTSLRVQTESYFKSNQLSITIKESIRYLPDAGWD